MPWNRNEDEGIDLFELSLSGLWSAQETAHEVEWRARFDDLDEIAQLQANWDGEGAETPSDVLLKSVKTLLRRMYDREESPPTRIVPTPDGTVVIEWQDRQLYRECEVTDPSRVEWFVQFPGGESAAWEEGFFVPSETWVDDWMQGDAVRKSESDPLWQEQFLVAA